MIYLEPHTLGWQPIMRSWINELPEVLTKDNTDVIESMFEWLIEPTALYIRKQLKVCKGIWVQT